MMYRFAVQAPHLSDDDQIAIRHLIQDRLDKIHRGAVEQAFANRLLSQQPETAMDVTDPNTSAEQRITQAAIAFKSTINAVFSTAAAREVAMAKTHIDTAKAILCDFARQPAEGSSYQGEQYHGVVPSQRPWLDGDARRRPIERPIYTYEPSDER